MIQLRKNSRPWSVAPAGDRRPRPRKLRLELLEDRRMLAAAADGLFGEQNIISADADKARSVFAADVDGDGDMDVLSASSGKIAWYENDGSGGFTSHTISSDISAGWSVFAVDVDGDGDGDVLGTSLYGASRIAWYENDGNEAFTAHTLSVVADSAFSVFAADVNGDDKIDVIEADLAADDEDALKAQQLDNGPS